MKRAAALVALGTVLVLAGSGCGGSGSASRGHGILLVRQLKAWARDQVVLWSLGSPPKPLGPKGYAISGPSWSPGGRFIAFGEDIGYPANSHPTPREIYVMRPDGSKVKELFDVRNAPAWLNQEANRSPSGSVATVERSRIVVTAKSGRVESLPVPAAARPLCGLTWSPNGKQILAASGKAKALPSGLEYPAMLGGLWVATVGTNTWRRLPLPMRKNEYWCSLSWR